ncbi:hypothetical protein CSB45_14455 [candidate division KSB3 bacterium]|uniref:ComEC/Rec2-related protein domain-containing protein n=1 Tax=candidate division KSB3 bacterium TaxID=2044937 RepID=A0A2G6E103_9BACT|nr:MAG: hypothetical protein CSB45_14455 [candidate division KSB3 bacterium]PIE28403.1 MAG: hypothetical protein CSA57_13895 [candidate division KSB3 bacterium]
MFRLYGRPAALLCASPVFALMIHQPCSDTLLFGCLLVVQRLLQLAKATRLSAPFSRGDRRGLLLLAGLVYGLSWMIKPLTILTLPFLSPQLGLAGFGSLGIWGAYILWSRRWEFGRRQFAFLLHQLAFKSMKRPGRQRLRPPSPRPPSALRWHRLSWRLRWRWEHLGRRAVAAIPFYLFPAWLQPWTWKGFLLAAAILLGYGNSKYLLLDLLFLFPVVGEAIPHFLKEGGNGFFQCQKCVFSSGEA